MKEIREIGIFSICLSSYYDILNRNGVFLRYVKRNEEGNNRKYQINDKFFREIDTSEKAYILGFLFADGNTHKKYGHVKLKVQDRDSYILEDMKKIMGYNKPLYFHKKSLPSHRDQYSLVICNKNIKKDLIDHGLVPNKTFVLKFPVLKSGLYSHFVRGYFDGDGSVMYHTNNGTIKPEIKIVSSSAFCLKLLSYLQLNKINCLYRKDKRTSDGINEVRIRSKDDTRRFYDLIYANSTICLTRKKEKFHEIFNLISEFDKGKEKRRKEVAGIVSKKISGRKLPYYPKPNNQKRDWFYEGGYYSIQGLSDIATMSYDTMYRRLSHGWIVDDAVNVPVGKKNSIKYT